MSIELAIRERLTSDATISGLVSNRVIPAGHVPQTLAHDWPRIEYQIINAEPRYHHGGDSDLINSRIQFDIRSDDVSQAITLRDAVKDRLTAATWSHAGKTIQRSHVDSIDGTAEPLRAGSDRSIQRYRIDIVIDYKEA